jgi:ubiquinone/menaquinone biosynthesis C-methylase UbiE
MTMPLASTAGNVYDKYHTRNVLFRFLMDRFSQAVAACMSDQDAPKVLELGCGEGYLACELLRRRTVGSYTGVDIDARMIRLAQRNCEQGVFEVGSAYELGRYRHMEHDYILVVEVLEHLGAPERALAEIRRLPGRTFIFTVPNEPLWRCLNLLRLRYVRDLGNTPGHIQHWNVSSFRKLLSRHFVVQELRPVFPWILAVCH